MMRLTGSVKVRLCVARKRATSPSDTKPIASPFALTTGAALMPLSTSICTASQTVAVSGRVYTSRFMMGSRTPRRSPVGSALAASPGRLRTSRTAMAKPTTHRPVATANAMLTPWMPACTASIDPEAALDAAVDTDTSTAVPSDPATWRSVLLTEVPCAMSELSSAFMAHVVMGMFTRASENMRTV